jgi:hypothetical protein
MNAMAHGFAMAGGKPPAPRSNAWVDFEKAVDAALGPIHIDPETRLLCVVSAAATTH